MFLRRYFGEEGGTACGLCDVCRGRPERPESFWEPIAQPEHRKKRKRRRRGRRRTGQERPQSAHPVPSGPRASTSPGSLPEAPEQFDLPESADETLEWVKGDE